MTATNGSSSPATPAPADGYRIEHDSMGEVAVPASALWGAQTQRAVQNFPVSGEVLHRDLIMALASVKAQAALANVELGVLAPDVGQAIHAAAARIAAGEYLDQFPLDVFQTGSGTSSNMNANEVIATLASRELGRPVHPNDHVNASQSSNDVFPSAIHLAAARLLVSALEPGAGRAGGRAGGQVGGVRRRGEGRAHPPDGRHAGHAGPGVRRLRGGRPARDRPASAASCPTWASCRWAARRSGPG